MRSVLPFFEYFVFGFSRHLTLICVLVLLGAIVFARFGRSFGIDRLFWHESAPLQFRAGVATALLFAKVGFVGYLLDAQSLEPLGSFSGPRPADHVLGAARYLALLSLPVGLAWGLLGVFAARAPRAPLLVPRTWFVVGAASGFFASVGLLVAFARVAPRAPAVPRWLVALLFLERVSEPLRPLHVLAAIFVLALSAEYVVYAVARESFTPAVAICTLLGLVTGVTGFLEFRAWNQSALALAFLGAVCRRPNAKPSAVRPASSAHSSRICARSGEDGLRKLPARLACTSRTLSTAGASAERLRSPTHAAYVGACARARTSFSSTAASVRPTARSDVSRFSPCSTFSRFRFGDGACSASSAYPSLRGNSHAACS